MFQLGAKVKRRFSEWAELAAQSTFTCVKALECVCTWPSECVCTGRARSGVRESSRGSEHSCSLQDVLISFEQVEPAGRGLDRTNTGDTGEKLRPQEHIYIYI